MEIGADYVERAVAVVPPGKFVVAQAPVGAALRLRAGFQRPVDGLTRSGFMYLPGDEGWVDSGN